VSVVFKDLRLTLTKKHWKNPARKNPVNGKIPLDEKPRGKFNDILYSMLFNGFIQR